MKYPLYEKDLILPDVILFKDRAAFKAHFGFQAPEFNPTKPKQFWSQDPIKGEGVNLPGAEEYPDYVPPPSEATQDGHEISPLYVSTATEAAKIMEEIQKDTGKFLPMKLHQTTDANDPHAPVYKSNRKMWMLGTQLVGELLHEKYLNGVGSPGKWKFDGEYVSWESTAVVTDNNLPIFKPPTRDLLPTEMWVHNLMGDSFVMLKPVEETPHIDEGTEVFKLLQIINSKLDTLLLGK